MHCAECGLLVPELVEGSCPACFVKRNELLSAPGTVNVVRCAHCRAVLEGGLWKDTEEDDDSVAAELARAAVSADPRVTGLAVDVIPDRRDERNIEYDVEAGGRFLTVNVARSFRVKARLKQSACERCSRQTAGYYNAVIQVRATDRELREGEREKSTLIVDEVVSKERRGGGVNAFVSKVEDVKGGRDFFLGDIEMARRGARALQKLFAADYNESPRLQGRMDGHDVYRVTFLVRISAYKPGDFIVHGDEVFQVTEMNNKTVTLLPLMTHDKRTVERDALVHAKVLGGEEIRKWAVVVSSVRDEMLLLDPESLKTQETPIPKKYEAPRMSPSVPTVKYEERLWLAPYAPEPPGESVKRVYLRRKPSASSSPAPAGA